MGSKEAGNKKPHLLCIPFPAQSHIKAMLKFAKLLHHGGFHITFVNTEFNHKLYLKSLGPDSLDGLPDFRFETMPDGLQSSDEDTTQDLISLVESVGKNFTAPFRDILVKLERSATCNDIPPVSHIVSDGWMAFTVTAAEEVGIPVVLFFTISASSFMGFNQYPTLEEKGLAPLKEESWLTNGFLDKVLDWVPGMKDIRLRDLPNNFITTDPNDVGWVFCLESIQKFKRGSAIVIHTFDALEHQVLDSLSSMFPRVYAIGPHQLLLNRIPEPPLKAMGYSLWKEETECLQWLNSKAPNSVVYVNFGSLAFVTPEHLVEFGWGLANSKVPFFWVIRPDLVVREWAIFQPEFVAETKERGLIASWCPQEQVLEHSSVGGFLTHSGWNSTIESLCAGVPMLCLPCFSDQQTNCYCVCKKWGIGMEISYDVKRDEVEKLVIELMEGEKGKQMKNKVMEWKQLAEEATAPHGSSSTNLDNFVKQVLLRKS
ncbi:7-deoxyloganetin glucosyltransferase-like isoform X1 [Malus sylvestris]|uniref:7-deoxyloganetin glucosyltransferase-like isoform X1 n=2 Tax=Malus sylvestris TaxID=3752 RepID=UPI0021AC05FD|nr:7-deoxyloganetin glucosyltransferase-like isoform X1 [Malus sylvestris]